MCRDKHLSNIDIQGSYFIETWGCQMNFHDSEKLSGSLKRLGLTAAAREEDANVLILNTCSIREKAEEKVFAHLGRLKAVKRQRPVVIGVAGCVAQQEGEAVFARAPHVDFVLGTQSLVELPRVLERVRSGERVVEIGRHPENLDIPPEQIDRVEGVKAFITIMEGCDNFCSFCIVPFTRGRERCRTLRSIVAEARALAGAGFKEVQLLGQNVNSYQDPETGSRFPELLDAVNEVAGIRRIRFTTPHPKDFDRALMERFRDLAALCPHMHLPAQSGSTSVLERMRRGYTREDYLAKVEAVRGLVPGIGLSTDLIVGFSGETEAEFQATLDLIREVGYDSIYSFKYSERPHTLAFRQLPDDVPEPVKSERLSRLQEAQRRIQERKNATLVGSLLEVLVDGQSKRDPQVLSGRSPDNRVVNFPGPWEWIGEIVEVEVRRAGANSVSGEVRSGGKDAQER
jgi:tRNA-2-methylthio-N6-dimethylallyladenosine synthase